MIKSLTNEGEEAASRYSRLAPDLSQDGGEVRRVDFGELLQL